MRLLFTLLALNLINTFALYCQYKTNYVDSTSIPGDSAGYQDLKTVYATEFNKGAITHPIQLIKGKIPGLNIYEIAGNDPNPRFHFHNHGQSTVYSNTDPLYILDGIEIPNIDFLSPEDILSMKVLTSLSETAVYGIKGSNGVILINTKKPENEKISVGIHSYGYMEQYMRELSYLTPDEYRMLMSKLDNIGGNFIGIPDLKDYGANTYWREEISQQKISFSNHVSVSGQKNKTTYMASVKQNQHHGILKKIENKNIGGHVSISQKLFKNKFTLRASLYNYIEHSQQSNRNPFLNHGEYGESLIYDNILSFSNKYNPTIPVYTEDGNYGMELHQGNTIQNPVQRITNVADKREKTISGGTLHLNHKLFRGLSVFGSLSFQTMKLKANFSSPALFADNIFNSFEKFAENDHLHYFSNDFGINQRIELKNHHFEATLKYIGSTDNHLVTKRNIQMEENETTAINDFTSIINQKFTSLSGILEYDYQDKFGFAYSLTNESLLRLPENGILPSLTAYWSLGNTKMFNFISWLNALTLYSGWGKSQRPTFYDNTMVTMIPEKMVERNYGIYLALLRDRIIISSERYNRLTWNAMNIIKIPTGFGMLGVEESLRFYNEIILRNKGKNIALTLKPIHGTFAWAMEINYNKNRNIVLSDSYIANRENQGMPIGNFYGFRYAGFNERGEVLHYTPEGDTTSFRTMDNYQTVGNSNPVEHLGLTTQFKYKSLELRLSLIGAFGFDIKYPDKLMGRQGAYNYNFPKEILSSSSDEIENYIFELIKSDYIIQKGDYLKVSEISLSYSFRPKKDAFNEVTVYGVCNNPWVFTSFKSGNPETSFNPDFNDGYRYELYPQTRVIVLGVKLKI